MTAIEIDFKCFKTFALRRGIRGGHFLYVAVTLLERQTFWFGNVNMLVCYGGHLAVEIEGHPAFKTKMSVYSEFQFI